MIELRNRKVPQAETLRRRKNIFYFNNSLVTMAMPGILLNVEEIWRIIFDGAKGLSTGERIGVVILIAILSFVAILLKEYFKEKEVDVEAFTKKNPTLIALLQFAFFALGAGFLIWFFYGLFTALK